MSVSFWEGCGVPGTDFHVNPTLSETPRLAFDGPLKHSWSPRREYV